MGLIRRLMLICSLSISGLGQAGTEITIDVNKLGPVINKNIYGQFAEHLGRLFYGGLWVGPESEIANTRGWRNDVLQALGEIEVPVIRWPGGCFADEYHWRNGIGSQAQRPVTVNTLWGGVEESNAVGTHEFFDLVELLGAEAYVSGNLGSGSPREMAEWLEYMTSDSQSGLAQLRRKNGRDKPFRLHHFAIGNESWGCGGHMTPQYYTDLFKHWSTMLRPPWEVPTKMVASGGHGYGDAVESSAPAEWTDYLTAHIKPNFLLGFDAVSFHYYTHPKGSVMEAKGSATQFPEEEWISTLASTLKMDGYLSDNKAVMNKNDPSAKIALYIDEWGSWYDPEPGTNPAYLYQQNTLRDAVVAALNFNIFHRYADRVQMANIAQMVNVLQAMILTEGDSMVLTPTYHVFNMYLPFQGANTLPLALSAVDHYKLGDVSIPAVSATAARAPDGKVYLAVVNVDPQQDQNVTVNLVGMNVDAASGQILTAGTMDAHNSFEKPLAISPKRYDAKAGVSGLVLNIPAKAVLVVTLN